MKKNREYIAGILAVGNYDSNVGYAWRLMERLWCELALIGHQKKLKTYVCFPTISKVPECISEARCEVEQIDFTRNDLSSVLVQLDFIRRKSIKIIYLTDFDTISFRYLLFRMCGVEKVIVHDHTPGVRPPSMLIKRWLKVIANRLPLISCTACFAVSPYIRRRLIDVNCVPAAKVHCVTNGIEVRTTMKPRPRPEHRPLIIVTVGRASYYKGIDFALRVIRSLVLEHGCPNIQYVLFGDGPDLEAFKRLAVKLEIEPHVDFCGAVNNVAERLQACDIAFHPSKGEAMSLAILEYMRAGLPVVASDNPSVSSILEHEHDSLIYQEGSLESAAKVLYRLVKSPEYRNQLGSSGQSKVQEEFSTEAMLARFRQAVSDVIG